MKNITTVPQNMHQKEVMSKLPWKIKYYSIAYKFTEVYPEISKIARKARNSSGVTWKAKFPLLFSGVEASNRLSVEVFSASNVVRIRGSGSFISFSIEIWTC